MAKFFASMKILADSFLRAAVAFSELEKSFQFMGERIHNWRFRRALDRAWFAMKRRKDGLYG